MNSLARLCLLLPALFFFPSCELLDKKDKFSITFHTMAPETDMKKTMFPVEMEGRQVLFKLVPEFSQENVTAFHSFTSEDGLSNGLVLKLDFRGAGALEIITQTPPGPYLLAMVNGQPVDYLSLDQRITDGIITIWQGVPDLVIKEMDKKYPRMIGRKGPSMSSGMEMGPITKREKADAYKAAKEAELKLKMDAQTGKKEGLVMPQFPQASPSPKIPVEGGTPPQPGVPPSDPPLPKP